MNVIRLLNVKITSSLSDFFVLVVRIVGRITRSVTLLVMMGPQISTVIGQKSLPFRGPVAWNSVPSEFQDVPSWL